MLEESERNENWFRDHYDELVEKFDGEHVAIYKGDVVDHDRDLAKLVERVKGKYPMGLTLFKYVSKEKLVFLL
ncbi:MAG: DUF5678 domain-containing protein [Candidatus Bathyarchaeales archaeon]